MQTFLPFPDFTRSAKSLDYRRLGKQRVEALQLLRALEGATKGWRNHPAAKMWEGHLRYLSVYGLVMCDEWISRGYKDSIREQFTMRLGWYAGTPPSWLGNDEFHRSHQSNLVRKLPVHYAPLFPGVPADLPYVWPSPQGESMKSEALS